MINVKLQYILCLTFLITLNVAYAEQPESVLSVKELKDIVPKIKVAEEKLHNIKIESEAWVEIKADINDPCDYWQRTPTYISSTAWFDLNHKDKARVDFHKEVLKWENGPAPYLERNYSISFDGQHGKYVDNSAYHSGKVFNTKKCRVLSDVPHELSSGWYQKMIGIKASLNFYFNGEPWGLSDYFQKAAEPNFAVENAKLDFVYHELRDAKCVKMSVIGGKFHKNWWFDPNRGFALLKYEDIRTDENGKETMFGSIDVTKLSEVAKGVWWPVEVYFINPPAGVGNPWERIVYHATNVVANAPNFDDSIFTVPTPEGYSTDKAERKEVYTGNATKK
jgi:hypothetical protein